MAHYQYRDWISSEEPLVRAAFTVAKEGHDEVLRGKAGTMPNTNGKPVMYITHPIMVHDILKKMGEDSPVMLASGLLHDVLEEKNGKYKDNPERLLADLVAEYEKEMRTKRKGKELTNDDRVVIRADAAQVLQYCAEMKNEPGPNGKVRSQIDRVRGMTIPGRKIKLADQMASLIDNLTMENDDSFPPDKQLSFTRKARDLMMAILQVAREEGHEQEIRVLDKWEGKFSWVLFQARSLIAAPNDQEKKRIRDAFDSDLLFNAKVDLPKLEVARVPRIYASVLLENTLRGPGLRRVDLSESGRVVSYVIDETKETNTLQDAFVKELEKKHAVGDRRDDPVRIGEATPIEGKGGRIFYMSPSMDVHDFCEAAIAAKVTTAEAVEPLIELAGRLAYLHEAGEQARLWARAKEAEFGQKEAGRPAESLSDARAREDAEVTRAWASAKVAGRSDPKKGVEGRD